MRVRITKGEQKESISAGMLKDESSMYISDVSNEVYDDLDAHIIESGYDVRCFGFDPYNAKDFVERMIQSGHGAMLEHGTVYLTIPGEHEPDEWGRADVFINYKCQIIR